MGAWDPPVVKEHPRLENGSMEVTLDIGDIPQKTKKEAYYGQI